MNEIKNNSVDDLFQNGKQPAKGRLKIYIGMSAGVGKTYRMLQEAHALQHNNINVKIGYVETHGRKETQDLIEGLDVIFKERSFL